MDAFRLSLAEASRLLHSNVLSPSELLESLLQRIEALEPRLQAWVTIDRDGVRAVAEQYTREQDQGRLRGPLHGIPIGLKDIYYTKGLKTTAGSKVLADFIPTYDATTVVKLKAAGAIILGKTETTEFASIDPAPTRNPWNTDHTPGGSSSGSAAAVSTGMCPTALGSQTGGSTIRPAAYCGIVGLKPTYGRISRYGMIPLSWSLDHVGIFTRTVEDAAIVLEVLAGADSKDPASAPHPVPSYQRAVDTLSPPRLGLLKEFFHDNAHEDVRRNLEEVVVQLRNAGAQIVETRLPQSFKYVLAAQRILSATESAAFHEVTFRRRMTDYRPKIRGSIAAGHHVPTTTYLKAQRVRSRFLREITVVLEPYDCFLTPSTTTPAPKGLTSTGDPAFNRPWSLCGLPAITIPSGLSTSGLPLGIQLVGRAFDEVRVLSVARWSERVLGFGPGPHDPQL